MARESSSWPPAGRYGWPPAGGAYPLGDVGGPVAAGAAGPVDGGLDVDAEEAGQYRGGQVGCPCGERGVAGLLGLDSVLAEPAGQGLGRNGPCGRAAGEERAGARVAGVRGDRSRKARYARRQLEALGYDVVITLREAAA